MKKMLHVMRCNVINLSRQLVSTSQRSKPSSVAQTHTESLKQETESMNASSTRTLLLDTQVLEVGIKSLLSHALRLQTVSEHFSNQELENHNAIPMNIRKQAQELNVEVTSIQQRLLPMTFDSFDVLYQFIPTAQHLLNEINALTPTMLAEPSSKPDMISAFYHFINSLNDLSQTFVHLSLELNGSQRNIELMASYFEEDCRKIYGPRLKNTKFEHICKEIQSIQTTLDVAESILSLDAINLISHGGEVVIGITQSAHNPCTLSSAACLGRVSVRGNNTSVQVNSTSTYKSIKRIAELKSELVQLNPEQAAIFSIRQSYQRLQEQLSATVMAADQFTLIWTALSNQLEFLIDDLSTDFAYITPQSLSLAVKKAQWDWSKVSNHLKLIEKNTPIRTIAVNVNNLKVARTPAKFGFAPLRKMLGR